MAPITRRRSVTGEIKLITNTEFSPFWYLHTYTVLPAATACNNLICLSRSSDQYTKRKRSIFTVLNLEHFTGHVLPSVQLWYAAQPTHMLQSTVNSGICWTKYVRMTLFLIYKKCMVCEFFHSSYEHQHHNDIPQLSDSNICMRTVELYILDTAGALLINYTA